MTDIEIFALCIAWMATLCITFFIGYMTAKAEERQDDERH